MLDRRATILLVDDHALFRESVTRFLESESDFRVVGGCGTVAEAREFLLANEVDIVLLDFDLGGRDGIDFMLVAESIGYRGKVLLVTARLNATSAANLVRRGVAGIFLKHNPPAVLVDAIRMVLGGKAWFESSYVRKLAVRPSGEDEPRTRKLTKREQQVLAGVFEGFANKQIADQLQVSESSVKATLQQLFHKTGVRTRSQLVRIALEQYRDLV